MHRPRALNTRLPARAARHLLLLKTSSLKKNRVGLLSKIPHLAKRPWSKRSLLLSKILCPTKWLLSKHNLLLNKILRLANRYQRRLRFRRASKKQHLKNLLQMIKRKRKGGVLCMTLHMIPGSTTRLIIAICTTMLSMTAVSITIS